MDYSKAAEEILKGVGGEENVNSVIHCATRLRFKIKDQDKVDDKAVAAATGVMTTANSGGQYQVVIGNEVPEVYAAMGKLSSVATAPHADSAAGSAADGDGEKINLFNRFVRMISAIFTPLLWPLAATGLLKAFLAMAVTFGWLSNETHTFTILNALSDAFIYFLPLALAISAARHFKASEFTSFAVAGALVYPSIVGLAGATDVTFFGIPVIMVSYVSSVIPIIIIVWLQSYVERFLYAKLWSAIRRFVTPMIVILVFVPLTLLVIGPISSFVSTLLADGIGWVFEVAPWLGGLIIGGVWQVLVIFGIHWGFVPLFVLEFQETGQILILAPIFAAVLAQGAAAAGVWVRTRNKRMRELAAPATLSGLLAGITEPAIYGVNLPLKRPFAFGIVGGAVGGALIAAGGVASNSFVLPGGLSIPALFGSGSTIMMVLGLVASVVIPFVLVLVVGFKDPVGDADPGDAVDDGSVSVADAGDVAVLSPLTGTAVPLSEVPDPVFADGTMGDGVAIVPSEGALYAPFDGVVVAAFPTGHAIGLRHASGAELLIHIGIDTVALEGQHFTLKVATGQEVKAGDLLVEFDPAAIEQAGYSLVTPVIITNGDDYPNLGAQASGPITHGHRLFMAIAKEKETAA